MSLPKTLAKIWIGFLINVFFLSYTVLADTIYLKDEKLLKGLVVEDYPDRITLSTVDGEIQVLKSNISKIIYEEPEQNYLNLARQYTDREQLNKAIACYEKALELNPDSKEAREGLTHARMLKWRREADQAKKEVEHKRELLRWWHEQKFKKEALPLRIPGKKESELKELLGLSLIEEDGWIGVDSITPHSSAETAGIKKGDLLIALWGRLIGYSKFEDVITQLLGPKHSEIRVTIEREVNLVLSEPAWHENVSESIGFSLDIKLEGLTVTKIEPDKPAHSAGLKEGDLIVAIENQPTRYMSKDEALGLVKKQLGSRLNLIIRRELFLMRGGGGK